MYLFVLGFFYRYLISTGQSNLSIIFRIRLISAQCAKLFQNDQKLKGKNLAQSVKLIHVFLKRRINTSIV